MIAASLVRDRTEGELATANLVRIAGPVQGLKNHGLRLVQPPGAEQGTGQRIEQIGTIEINAIGPGRFQQGQHGARIERLVMEGRRLGDQIRIEWLQLKHPGPDPFRLRQSSLGLGDEPGQQGPDLPVRRRDRQGPADAEFRIFTTAPGPGNLGQKHPDGHGLRRDPDQCRRLGESALQLASRQQGRRFGKAGIALPGADAAGETVQVCRCIGTGWALRCRLAQRLILRLGTAGLGKQTGRARALTIFQY